MTRYIVHSYISNIRFCSIYCCSSKTILYMF